MKINNISSQNFNSNIKIVSPKHFDRIVEKMSKDGAKNVTNWDIAPATKEVHRYGYIRNMKDGFTKEVRSCTAGVIASDRKVAPLFMHISNTADNCINLPRLHGMMWGKNAILVGSKNICNLSSYLFNAIKRCLTQENIPVSIFEDLNDYYEAHLAYKSESDTLYLAINDATNIGNFVKNQDELNKAFRNIQLSSYDNVEFLEDTE